MKAPKLTGFKTTLMYQTNWAWALSFIGTQDGPDCVTG